MPNTTPSPFESIAGRLEQDRIRAQRLSEAYGGAATQGGSTATRRIQEEAYHHFMTTPAVVPSDSRAAASPRMSMSYQDISTPAMRIHFEGSDTLLAEVQEVYDILSEYPSPADRTEEEQEELTFILTERIATNSNNRTQRNEPDYDLF